MIPVFQTDDLETLVGQVEVGAYPVGVAYDPRGTWGAADRSGSGGEILVFNPRSLARKRSFPSPRTRPVESVFLGFGGDGKKVVCATLTGVHNKDEGVVLLDRTDGAIASRWGSDEDEAAEKAQKTTKPRAKTRKRPGRSTP